MGKIPKQYYLQDNGNFPNSCLPVLHYRNILNLPFFFPALSIKKLFRKNGWTNTWKDGLSIHYHYHSITHEVLGIYKGRTILQLGGNEGIEIVLKKGDVLIIPAGVAHRNMGNKKDVLCVGAYPDGRHFDMNYGRTSERPRTDRNIASLSVPSCDPIFGENKGVTKIWRRSFSVKPPRINLNVVS